MVFRLSVRELFIPLKGRIIVMAHVVRPSVP